MGHTSRNLWFHLIFCLSIVDHLSVGLSIWDTSPNNIYSKDCRRNIFTAEIAGGRRVLHSLNDIFPLVMSFMRVACCSVSPIVICSYLVMRALLQNVELSFRMHLFIYAYLIMGTLLQHVNLSFRLHMLILT